VNFGVTAVDPELVELLVGRGADLGLRSRAGERPVDIAIRHGQTDLVSLLGG
jgi:ankyrin repeat protein